MEDILDKINRRDGMTVPDGYFADFAAKMSASLPEQPWEKKQPEVMPRSFWQKVRPYVYMAAMFLGVWCMMKSFDLMRPHSSGLSFDSNPVITAAINSDTFMSDYFYSNDAIDDYELMDDLYEDGYTPASYDSYEDNDYYTDI